jgi:methanogenic corrinoid protein MtbC1
LDFDIAGVKSLTQKEIDAGTAVDAILNEGLIAPMDEVGEKFSAGELFVPEILMAAKAMKFGLEILKPPLSGDTRSSKGTIVIGTVKGDLHDIGKNLLGMMMEGAGFEVIDLGADVGSDAFVKAVREAGMATKIIIGGAPVTEAFADQIGADGFSADAPGAVEIARRLMAA